MSHSNAKDKIRLIRLLLRSFVGHFASIYVDRHAVYNIHSIIHLPVDVENYDSLEKFSAFPFENMLGIIKKSAKSKQASPGNFQSHQRN